MRKRKSGLDVSPLHSLIVMGMAALCFYWVYNEKEKNPRTRAPASIVEASSALPSRELPKAGEQIQSAQDAADAAGARLRETDAP